MCRGDTRATRWTDVEGEAGTCRDPRAQWRIRFNWSPRMSVVRPRELAGKEVRPGEADGEAVSDTYDAARVCGRTELARMVMPRPVAHCQH